MSIPTLNPFKLSTASVRLPIDMISHHTRATGMAAELPGRICGVCRSGPFPSTPGLRRHIRQVPECRRAAQNEFREYLSDIWTHDLDEVEEAPPSPSIETAVSDSDPEPDTLAGVIDNNLDSEEIAGEGLGDHIFASDATDNQAAEDVAPPSNNEEYIEEFPAQYRAGAGWSASDAPLPKFQDIHQRQSDNIYAPFENKDEWDMGQWLFKNVGQTQTEVFLRLPVVSSSDRVIRDLEACMSDQAVDKCTSNTIL
jgi:hypothetical protein